MSSTALGHWNGVGQGRDSSGLLQRSVFVLIVKLTSLYSLALAPWCEGARASSEIGLIRVRVAHDYKKDF